MPGPSRVRLSTSAPLIPGLDTCPHCNKRLPRIWHREKWVEEPVEGGWIAAYRLMVKAGRPVVAEVRLHPDHPPGLSGSGRWSEDPSAVPSDGVPGRALR